MTNNTDSLPPLPLSEDEVRRLWDKACRTVTVQGGGNDVLVFADYLHRALAAQQGAQVPQSERAWLVEWRFNGVQWLYLWPSAPGGFSFTADPNSALRFARREDAEACFAWAREVDRRRGAGVAGGELLVTDHEWNTPASPQAPAQPVEDDKPLTMALELASAWRKLFEAVARELGCLPSTYVKGNDHVIRAARKLRAAGADDSERVAWRPHLARPPALVTALRGLLASLSRAPTEFELRVTAHEFTVMADRAAAAARKEES